MAKSTRHQFASMGYCDSCHLTHYVHYAHGDLNQWSIQNVQHRFAYKGTKWHMTYRLDSNTTTFVTVQKQPSAQYKDGIRIEQPKIRAEHCLPGYVEPSRFP